jgi:hypothetical protein
LINKVFITGPSNFPVSLVEFCSVLLRITPHLVHATATTKHADQAEIRVQELHAQRAIASIGSYQ